MSPTIRTDIATQQAMQAKGITSAVGSFGDHKVQLGENSPINLAKIKANKVPFAGFKTATKVARGQEGVRQTAGDAIKALGRPGGKLDARELLGALKAQNIHLGRLDALGQIPEAHRDDPTVWAFGNTVENMSNAELAAVYQNFTSAEMELLQTSLQREGQLNPNANDARAAASQLFDLQAMVLKEVSIRVAHGEAFTGGTDITPANLHTLVETSAQSATTREKTAGQVQQGLENRNIEGMSARDMGDILRSAELTVNIDAGILLGDNSVIAHPDEPMKNIFHLAAENVLPKGEGYIQQRDAAERLLFPEFEGHDVNPNERPIYGALNVGRRQIGAVPTTAGYGTASIVLKPEVSQRSTYMAEDTFYSPVLDMGQDRRDAFYGLLDSVVGDKIPARLVEECRTEGSEKHQALEAWFDNLAQEPDLRASAFRLIPSELGLDADAQEVFTAHLLNTFGDKEATRKTMATHDNLEALIPNMSSVTANSIARAVEASTDGTTPRLHLAGVQYIEAQIQGPIVPSRDIAEIRIDLNDIPRGERAEVQARMEAFEKATGIPVKLIDYDLTTEAEDLLRVDSANKDFNAAHWDQTKIDGATTSITQNMQARLKDLMQADPDMRGALQHVEGQDIVRGNALAKLTNKFHAAVKSAQADTTKNYPNEEALVNAAFKKVADPVLKTKASLLNELENLEFQTPEQKEAFTHWALSAKALHGPQELRIIHTHASAQAKTLDDLANRQPQPSADEVLRSISELNGAASKELDAFIATLNDDDFGADDKATELARISFMSCAMLEKGINGDTVKERVSSMLNRPEQRQLAGQINRVLEEPDIEFVKDYGHLRATSMLMEMNTSNINQLTGARTQPAPVFTAELSLLPESTRAAMRDVCPDVAQRIDSTHPGYEPFPVPANGAQLPSTDTGRREFLVNHLDTYMGHEQTFEKGTSVHGRGHIARAFIFATAMSNMLEQQGVQVDRNAVLCGITGHDMGRQGRGSDAWEARSAAMTLDAMRGDFGPQSMGEAYETAVTDCIDAHKGQTVEAMLLNAADSLDIGRTAQFDPEQFSFMHGKDGETRTAEADRIRQQLETEANLLQRLTNPLCAHKNVLSQLDEASFQAMQGNNMPAVEHYMGQKREMLDAIGTAFADEWNTSSEDFVTNMESTIAQNRNLFPLLSQYYPVQQA